MSTFASLALVAVASAIVNNVVLSQFLGICPFLGVSKKIETSAGMGGAVVFVIAIATFFTQIIYGGILANPKLLAMGIDLTYLKTILFIGGSAGAKVFNDFVSREDTLTQHFNVINITGDSSLNVLDENCYRVDYVTDLYQPLMDMADVVITRGGSNTIFELLAMQKLHIIVPLGREASRGDQLENAAYFEKKGYAKQLLQEDFTLENLEQAIADVIEHKEDYIAHMQASHELKTPDDFYQLLTDDISKTIKES